MDSSKLLADAKSVCADLQRMAQEIAKDLPGPEDVLIVGVHGKGVRVAAHINRLLDSVWRAKIPGGTLDVGMHRDDLDRKPVPRLQPTALPGAIQDKTILLVDDVIHSGRTIRAALDSLHDFGRPRRVLLATLIDRGQRCLPIQPDYVGRTVNIAGEAQVLVTPLDEDAEGFEVRIQSA